VANQRVEGRHPGMGAHRSLGFAVSIGNPDPRERLRNGCATPPPSEEALCHADDCGAVGGTTVWRALADYNRASDERCGPSERVQWGRLPRRPAGPM
jgi:hypothetical protein